MLTFGIFHALYSSTGVEIQKQDPFAHPVERILKFRTWYLAAGDTQRKVMIKDLALLEQLLVHL